MIDRDGKKNMKRKFPVGTSLSNCIDTINNIKKIAFIGS